MKKLYFLPLLLLILNGACKKDPVLPDNDLTPAMARDSLYYIMKEWYYWYDQSESSSINTENKNNYSDPYELLDAMRYRALDRWSFVADYDDFIAEMSGIFVGHGFRIGVDNQGNARIAMIYNNSPLYSDGVRRGWILKKVNNVELAPILISGDGAAYSSLIGPSQAGITNIFVFVLPDGTETTISSTKSTFTVNTVILYDTLHLSSGVTGHLVFESFIKPSADELATAFAFFKANNITDLIIDLRYNSGGYLYIAQALASYIAGDSYAGSIFAKLKYNDKHQDANSTYYYAATPSPLNLDELVVITSRSTASASEAVMNGLKPYVNIVSIGDTTNGKPTGMNGWDISQKYYMWPVTFTMVNSADEGDYFEGIIPDKTINDDITRDFNDKEELCLKEAIYYLENGTVSTKGESVFKSYQQFSERPAWMDNAFILKK